MSLLADRHIERNADLRAGIVERITRIWGSLPSIQNTNLDAWLSTVLPLVEAGQRTQVALTDAYLARALDTSRPAVSATQIVGAPARNGTAPADVYIRPFITVWSALSDGVPYVEAAARGLARAQELAATDVQLAMRDTIFHAGQADPDIWGYQRVADGNACDFCQMVNGAQFRTDDAMPLHPWCGCGVEPIVYTRGVANRNNLELFNAEPTPLPSGVAVHQHGELGPILGDPNHSVTTL